MKIASLIGVLIAISVFYYLFTTISVEELLHFVSEVDQSAVLLFFLCSFSMSLFHTWRFKLLLSVSGYCPPNIPLFLTVLARNLFSDLLPARIGTASYIVIAKTRLGIPLNTAISSFTYAFIFDLLSVAPLILIAALLSFSETAFSIPLLICFAIFFGLFFGAIVFTLPALSRLAARVLRRWQTIGEKIESIASEISAIHEAKVLGRVLILSLAIRIAKYAGLYMFLYALLTPRGYTFSDLPLPKVFLGICAAEFAASLPISGIAGLGTYQEVWLVVFNLLDFPLQTAKLTSVAHHLCTQIYGYSLGGLALLVLYLPTFAMNVELPQQKYRPETFMRFISKIAMFVALVLTIFGVVLKEDSQAKPFTDESGELSHAAKQTNLELLNRLSSDIVFDSNRSGTFGIYKLDHITGRISVLADDMNRHEMFPDVARNSKAIVYASARSSSRISESDIKIISESNNSQLLAKNGTFPTFSSDERFVYFERDRRKVIRIDLATREEQEIFPAKFVENFGKFYVVKPRVSTDATKIAFTSDKAGRWNVWVADILNGKINRISDGCQPTWKNDAILYIKNLGVNSGAGMFLCDQQCSSFYDQSDPWGHEYFPMLNDDASFMLYGSSNENDHDHETGNYQLFLRDLRNNLSVRLTYDNATNRWPKFFYRQPIISGGY